MGQPPGSDDGRRTTKERLNGGFMNISGKFAKVAETENSIVIGTIGALTEENTTHDVVIKIAEFYNINTEPDKFKWHCITPEGAIKRGCSFPVGNYNEFIEFFK